jgi:ribosomal protein S18 acetylase RimI-like enzyme
MPGVVQIPTTVQQLDQVRSLMPSFIAWHRERHREDTHLIDAYFDDQAFEQELAALPGKYAPPHGQLLLATLDGVPAGCVALRQLDFASCEMKRMFVYTQFHGRGVGRTLADAVIEQAKALGYRTMRLDTSIRQDEAKGLYQRLGFKIIEPYYELPEELKHWLVFMELVL